MTEPCVSPKEIVAYWMTRETECGLGVDWAEAHERCWRCGYKSRLQKCHIVPKALGGPNDASNLVLLCGRCHREAPNIQNPRLMWIWLRATCVPFYDTYWTARGIEEFERMFGRKPFTGNEFKGVDKDRASEFLKEEMTKTVVHFGEGRLNPATIASAFALVEERLTGKASSPVNGSSGTRYLLEAMGWGKSPTR